MTEKQSSSGSDPPSEDRAGATEQLTVRELLQQPCMESAVILAGATGQDTPIRRLNVMSVPEIVRWVEENEFLLTTGFPLRAHDDPARLIRELSDLRLAGLAVKFDAYLEAFDSKVLAVADELGFPIVSIPVDTRIDDILSQAFETIINRQAAELSRSHRLHHTFLGLTFSGGGIQSLMEELARLLGADLAAVVDSQGTILARAGAVEALRFLCADEHEDLESVDPSTLEKGQYTQDGVTWAVVPMSAASVDYGHVIVVGREGEMGPYAMTAAEQAAIVSTLEMIRGQAVRAVSGRFASNLLHELMTGDDLEGISGRAAALDWALNREIVVIAARPEDGRPVSAPVIEQAQAREQRTSERWALACRRIDPHAAAGVLGAQLVAIMGAELAKPDAITTLQSEMSTSTRREFAIGVSRLHDGLTGIRDAYEEALRALRLGARVNGPHAITDYDGLGLFRLLAQLDQRELQMFVTDTLGPVSSLPEPERTDLVQTLDVLLANHLNIAQSAREMHYHYNTLRSRMLKLEKLLGPFTTDAVIARRIGVALEILRMQGGRPL